jgi:hypothetical protein
MTLRLHHTTLLLFGLTLCREAFASVQEWISSVSDPILVLLMTISLSLGLIFGFAELKRPWLALAMSALVAFLICALLHRYVDPILAIILVVIYIVSAIVFVIIQALRAELSLKPELRNVWWKSPSKIIAIATVGCFVHAILDAVPTYYCRSAKKVFTPTELCVELFDRGLRAGTLLLGPDEKSAKDYHNNHPNFCRHGLTNFDSSQGAPNSWRLGGLYEFLFFDQTLYVTLEYHTTPFGKESWHTAEPLVEIWYELDNCLKPLRVTKSI